MDPGQIVIYTEPSCNSSKNRGRSYDHTLEPLFPPTLKPEALVGTTSTNWKGTYPLTSPPQPFRDDSDRKNPKTLKDPSLSGGAKNTNLGGDESQSLLANYNNNNKSNTEHLSNKSAQSIEGESAQLQEKHNSRLRRSTKMAGASSAATKYANMSDDIRSSVVGGNSTATTDNLLHVFFYLNNKSGSYDQDLTSSFVKLWNDSSRLANATDNDNNNTNNVGANVDGHVGSNSNNQNSGDEVFFKKVRHN